MASAETPDPLRDDKIAFEQMAAQHRASTRGYLLYALALVIIGTTLVALGLAKLAPHLPAVIIGTITIVVAVFPYLQSIEDLERLEGLAVLRDTYLQMTEADSGDRDRMTDLLSTFYAQARSSP